MAKQPDRFCYSCGAKLKVVEKPTGTYSTTTGKPHTRTVEICPNFTWREKYLSIIAHFTGNNFASDIWH